ncbi:polysaccharide deacetylase family protein [uncultured Propionivibrio sp.]|uniref:polysaccharide deacetylase family protein n=1 Tax=uncultured Propionivibrio sp. TaxID=426737 RepID=UPI0029C09AC9|nr:polysaccharide deacetylase family protein [uncultured Propionivibrio sp.]
MNLRRFLARTISETVAGVSWIRQPTDGLRVLMYHAIGTPALGDTLGLFSLSPERFRQHMVLLAGWQRGRVVELDGSALNGNGCRVAITFDDGYSDNLEVAAPVLSELGLPFTVFVTSEFVRNGKPGFLSPNALRDLAALPGARIGAHGANHVALTQCDDTTLRNELTASRSYLENVLGSEIRTLAYPYGAADRRVRDAALAAGYCLGACSQAGVNPAARDPLLLARTEIVSFDNERVFAQKLNGDWDWYRWRTQDPACR